jgi:hypothetical protein
VLYTNKLFAGDAIVVASVLPVNVTRGISTPLFVALISNIEDPIGLVVPIPTWAFIDIVIINSKQKIKIDLIVVFILIGFVSCSNCTP